MKRKFFCSVLKRRNITNICLMHLYNSNKSINGCAMAIFIDIDNSLTADPPLSASFFTEFVFGELRTFWPALGRPKPSALMSEQSADSIQRRGFASRFPSTSQSLLGEFQIYFFCSNKIGGKANRLKS